MNKNEPHSMPYASTGNAMHIVSSAHDGADGATEDEQFPTSAWEERFDMCEMDAILQMLHHLTSGLPGFLRNALLRRASRLPGLHGRFAPYYGTLSFHAAEGEVVGKSETWVITSTGERVKRW